MALPPRVAVAASGGRDSTALLHCTARAAAELGVEVHALHVHHGLQAAADGWWQQVQTQCQRWAQNGLPVHFHGRRLNGTPARGDSVEAWARRERYRALAEMAHAVGCDLVLLAHHRRDQAETLLLQALRGGGPAGLAAMPRSAQRAGITWQRPWLTQPRETIEAYVHRHRLTCADDASNADPRFARSRLRDSVWPALVAAFPDAETSLTGAARRAQEAAACLTELAAIDLAATSVDTALLTAPWQALSSARRSHVLRCWLARTLAAPAPETLVQRLARELPNLHAGRWPAPGGELRLHNGQLGLHATRSAHVAPLVAAVSGPLDLQRPGRIHLPAWGGDLLVASADHGGVAAADLQHVELRVRVGGERFQLAPATPPRGLKKQFQARGVPAWARDGPLLFSQGRLLFVPGLGIDARRLCPGGAAQLRLEWLPSPGPTPGALKQPS